MIIWKLTNWAKFEGIKHVTVTKYGRDLTILRVIKEDGIERHVFASVRITKNYFRRNYKLAPKAWTRPKWKIILEVAV